ncbi:5156_t:CDS:10, partial [Entrophospora sp. SA101]
EKIANVLENDLYFNSPTEKSQVHPYELPENVRHGHINYLNFDDIDDRLSPCINCFESYQVDEFDQGLAVEEINNETIEDVEDSREIVEQDWNDWTLESGVSVKEMIRKAAKLNGHKLSIVKLETSEAVISAIKNFKIGSPISSLEVPHTKFFLKMLKNLYPEHSVMQRENISESSYGLYVINQCLIELFCGEEKDVIYKPGEIILSSVESCRKRKKVVNSYEQKADGAFFTCIKKSLVEIGHLEISGGYNIVDKPRSTWDHLKGAIGNVYMLGELAHCYKKASNEAFSKVQVFFLHAYEKQIELWGMSNPTNGVLLMERISKSFVPIDWTSQQIHFFDFMSLLWVFKTNLLETVKIVNEVRAENVNNMFENVSRLPDSLPLHSCTPSKEAHRAGIRSIYAQSEVGTPNRLMDLFKPLIEEMDSRVVAVKSSQIELNKEIEQLTAELQLFIEATKPPQIQTSIQKLIDARKRLLITNQTLKLVHHCIIKMHTQLNFPTLKMQTTPSKKSLISIKYFTSSILTLFKYNPPDFITLYDSLRDLHTPDNTNNLSIVLFITEVFDSLIS